MMGERVIALFCFPYPFLTCTYCEGTNRSQVILGRSMQMSGLLISMDGGLGTVLKSRITLHHFGGMKCNPRDVDIYNDKSKIHAQN